MGNERTPLFEDQESSDSEDKESNAKKAKPPVRALNLTLSHEGLILPPRVEEAKLVRAPLFGEFAPGPKPEIIAEEHEDDDDDEEDEEKEAKSKQQETANAEVPLTAERANETDQEATQAADNTQPVAADAAPVSTEQFEDIMQQMGPEYTQATSGEELTPLEAAEEEPEQPQTTHPLTAGPAPMATEQARLEDEEDTPPVSATAGGGMPPLPPAPPPPGNVFNNYPLPATPNWNAAPAPTPAAGELRNTGGEKRNTHLSLIAAFLTGYVVKAYLEGRKRERLERETKRQMNERDEHIASLQANQQRLYEQLNARPETYDRPVQNRAPEARPAVPKVEQLPQPSTSEALPSIKAPDEKLFDEQGNEIVLQPGWRVERSAGGYAAVLNERNQVVYEAIHYGEAFRRDRRPEQLNPAAFGNNDAGSAPVGGSVGNDAGYASAPGGSIPLPPVADTPQPQPGQTYQPDEPAELEQADLNHRLPEPKNQLLAAATSPWLWTAVAVLLIIYFLAALA